MQQLASFNVFKKMKDKLEIIFYKSLGHNKKKFTFLLYFFVCTYNCHPSPHDEAMICCYQAARHPPRLIKCRVLCHYPIAESDNKKCTLCIILFRYRMSQKTTPCFKCLYNNSLKKEEGEF